MATGRKTVVVGQVIDPVVWGNPLWDQSVQEFASDADRTAQFPVAQRRAGVVTWRDDAQTLEVWDGAAWQPVAQGGLNPFTPWTAYTPQWLAAGAPVTLGTGGNAIGRYKKVGKTVDLALFFQTGAGFNGGANGAPWTWTLPAGIAPGAFPVPVAGWLQAAGQAIPLATLAARIQTAAGSPVADGVVGQGNNLVGGFAFVGGQMLMHTRFETA